MKNLLFAILVVLCLFSGCAEFPFRYVIANPPDFSAEPYTEIARINDSRQSLSWQIDDKVEQAGTFRVKYHAIYTTKHCVVVEGSIAGGKKKYPVVLDTGASQGVFVNDIHVLENKLPAYPVRTNKASGQDYGLGLCYVPELRIEQMVLLDFPCWYLQRHLQLEFLGLPIARDESIIVGLTALREFSCIVFDSINREVKFSRNQTFEPAQKSLWFQYPLSIEEDGYGNAFLFVQIPVAGESMKVQLDTGNGNGLALSEELWGKLSRKVQNVRLKRGHRIIPIYRPVAL